MVIREMTREECLQVLARGRFARLACTHENQPYIVPVYLAYQEASGCLYGFTTPGQKIKWMRANPLVCVEMDEIAVRDKWVSVIALGRYEELPETPGSDGARQRAPERPLEVGEAVSPRSADLRHRQCDDEERADGRARAYHILKTQPMWWEAGWAAFTGRADRDPAEPYLPVYSRIRIDGVTGHQATPDAKDGIVYPARQPLPLGLGAGCAGQ